MNGPLAYCVLNRVRDAAIAVMLCAAAHVAFASAPVMSCANLATVGIPNGQIISATEVAAANGLPAFCNVVGVINKRISTQDPDHFTYGIAFELNVPDAWNGRFELMGGGGTDGALALPVGFFGTELAQGWAVAIDDGGHENPPGAGGLSVNTPPSGVTWNDADNNAGGLAHFGVDEQARVDYGYNGIEQTAHVSKLLINTYYGTAPGFSYLCGCSNGGRDAMIATQRFPQLFDGEVAVNPGFNLPQALIASAWNVQTLAPLATAVDGNGLPDLSTTFSNADLEVASAAILSACDALDGLVDGIIDNYPACTTAVVTPALAQFTCSPNGAHGNTPHSGTCLTPQQVAALVKIYGGPVDSLGIPLYSHWFWDAGIWSPPAEGLALGWQAWNVSFPFFGPTGFNTAFDTTLIAGIASALFSTPPLLLPATAQEDFIFKYNFNTDPLNLLAATPAYPMSAVSYMNANSLDLFPFQQKGGKLILIDSLNDGIFSGASLVGWYQQLMRVDPAAQSFARLFLIPNMAHCGAGPATSIYQPGTLTAITSWVEQGQAPASIVARNFDQTEPFPNNGLFDPRVSQNFPTGGTRPLCPYPQQTRYNGTGATNNAANFSCMTPP